MVIVCDAMIVVAVVVVVTIEVGDRRLKATLGFRCESSHRKMCLVQCNSAALVQPSSSLNMRALSRPLDMRFLRPLVVTFGTACVGVVAVFSSVC